MLTVAHPRACGENTALVTVASYIGGSSPRMRGKPCRRSCGVSGSRLIPAHAGKTLARSLARTLARAHPRACGENLKGQLEAVTGGGSSPRMRGKPSVAVKRLNVCGLIPAHAGKTRRRPRTSDARRAHPRACGENQDADNQSAATLGSSPRMRGKPFTRTIEMFRWRLIPAHAGKT